MTAWTEEQAWLDRNNGLARRLAARLLEEDRPQDLPILADALEEAGCEWPELLAHFRSKYAHLHSTTRCDWLLGLMREAPSPVTRQHAYKYGDVGKFIDNHRSLEQPQQVPGPKVL